MNRKFTLVLVLWMVSLNLVFAQVTGNVVLINQTDHAGVKVKFIAQSPTASTDSTLSLTDGKFTINLKPGIYKIEYSKAGFPARLHKGGSGLLISSNTILETQYLIEQSNYLKGTISGTLKPNNIYIVDENLFVPANETLTIPQGVKIYFREGTYISLQGSLIAKGTIMDSVHLLSYSRFTNEKEILKWKGIGTENSTGSMSFQYCSISDITAVISNHSSKDLEIKNCFLHDVDIVLSSTGNLIFQDNVIVRNKLFAENGPSFGQFGVAQVSCNKFLGESSISVSCSTLYYHDNILNPIELSNTLHRITSTYCRIENNYFNNMETCQFLMEPYWRRPTLSVLASNTIIAKNTILPASSVKVSNNIINGYSAVDDDTLYPINRSVFEYNIFKEKFKVSASIYIGVGQKIAVNNNGDSTDSYYNLFQQPKFLNGRPPFLSSKSPALGSGINTSGQPTNIGLDPTQGCFKNYFSKEPEIISSDTLFISGKVHTGSSLLKNGLVMAINKTTSKTRIAKVSSNGNFIVDSLGKGLYILYAVPDPVTVPGYLPTYYLNKLKQEQAFAINLINYILDVDIYLLASSATNTGSSKIQGRFSYSDENTDDTTSFKERWFRDSSTQISPVFITGQPCKNMPVILYDAQGQAIKSSVTDTDGYYGFTNLSSGNYKIDGQRLGYTTENDGDLTLNAQDTKITSFRMLPLLTGLHEESDSDITSTTRVYPNPFKEVIVIKGFNSKITVSDITGNIIYENTPKETINTSLWSDGIYFLKTGDKVHKIIKN